MWIAVLFAIVVYVCIVVALSKSIRAIVQSKNIPVSRDIDIPYYLLAYFCGGVRNVAFSLLFRLYYEKILTLSSDYKTVDKVNKAASLSEFEKKYCATISDGTSVSALLDKNALTRLKSDIENDSFFKRYPQLIFTDAERTLRSTYIWYHVLAMGALVIFLFITLLGFNLLLLILVVIALPIVHSRFFSFPKNPEEAENVKNYQLALNPKLTNDSVRLPFQQQLTQVALYGPTVFAMLGWSAFADLYVRKDSKEISGGSGCGSSCSSSSCGSSCGGGSSDGGSSCGGGCGGCGGGD